MKHSHPQAADRPSPRRLRAFSLMELMVAITLLALLATMLLGIVESATRLWRQSESRVDGFREARAAAHVIRRDLEGIPSNASTNWFQLQAVTNGTLRGDRLFFVTMLPDAAQSGTDKAELCVVGYLLEWTPPQNSATSYAPGHYSLYRQLLRSNDTFTNHLSSGTALDTNVSTSSAGVELLARNVQSFELSAFSQSAGQSVEPFTQSESNAIPDVMELQILALNEDAARQLPDRSAWENTNTSQSKTSAQPFQTRIRLQEAP